MLCNKCHKYYKCHKCCKYRWTQLQTLQRVRLSGKPMIAKGIVVAPVENRKAIFRGLVSHTTLHPRLIWKLSSQNLWTVFNFSNTDFTFSWTWILSSCWRTFLVDENLFKWKLLQSCFHSSATISMGKHPGENSPNYHKQVFYRQLKETTDGPLMQSEPVHNSTIPQFNRPIV